MPIRLGLGLGISYADGDGPGPPSGPPSLKYNFASNSMYSLFLWVW